MLTSRCGESAPKEEIYHAFSLDIPVLWVYIIDPRFLFQLKYFLLQDTHPLTLNKHTPNQHLHNM